MTSDLFTQLTNAVLDLQSANLQTYKKPLKTIARLLHHDSLTEINEGLTAGIDLEEFLTANGKEGRGMGGGTLEWPEDTRQQLGLTYLLIEKLSSDEHFPINFSHQYFGAGSTKILDGIRAMVGQLIIPFARDYKAYVMSAGSIEPKLPGNKSNDKVFIVHGHDDEAKEKVARFLTNVGLVPVILHEQASRGRTIIEKIEAHADVGFAVILLTPDDEGRAKGAGELEPRARQNVLLELGYFLARLKRENVCALRRGTVEIPSDFAGVVWEAMDDGGAWKQALGKELEAAGYVIDWNKLMRA